MFDPELGTRFSQFPLHAWIAQGAERGPNNSPRVLDYTANGAYLERDADGSYPLRPYLIISEKDMIINLQSARNSRFNNNRKIRLYRPLSATVPGMESDSYCPWQPDRRARATGKCHQIHEAFYLVSIRIR